MTAPVRRAYGELDRDQVVAALYSLARRVGVQRVTMRELAAELGAKAPSVYYHVPGKQAALDLLAESVLASIAEPEPGPWDVRLTALYSAARNVMLDVPGIANVLQTNGIGHTARSLDTLSRALIAEAGLTAASADAAHAVLYTYLLGSISLEESRPARTGSRRKKQADSCYLEGLRVIIEGIRATAGTR
ncbi:TetR family transcriptional regulator [Mycolicibacter heraklionensis]|uniref:TetR family transcriptional regulator n=1 Tax=Mycolicibacter heraklionensis TaxID=512402 RepID=A0ABR5FF81_9MYCO|nr:TetR family transcriptional regulator [Mycolicibacter heraklionensis]KLO28754.1 TetR family transcriptional regulator [Mycolicibacter heraklionensis]